MPGTARRYGLIVNQYVDQRRDPIYSTEAAIKYLTDLYNVFNSWELAIAAYNCGEFRVLRAIMKGKSRDFWELSRQKLLPPETRNYVPKFLAAAIVASDLKKFGLNEPVQNSFPDVVAIDVPGGITLSNVSSILGKKTEEIVNINPSLVKKITPTWIESYPLWLIPEQAEILKKSLSKLSRMRVKSSLKTNISKYKVKRGDSLTSLSQRFRVSIRKLKRINGLRSSRIYVGQTLKIRSSEYRRSNGRKIYFVQKYDYIAKIARKFGLSVGYLKKLNGLHSSRIYVGQKLNVTPGVKNFLYIVKRGDNLTRIARLYKKSVRYIKKRNKLRGYSIKIGQKLNI